MDRMGFKNDTITVQSDSVLFKKNPVCEKNGMSGIDWWLKKINSISHSISIKYQKYC